MKDFIKTNKVPFDWVERLQELDDYTLFISDCFWMLKTKTNLTSFVLPFLKTTIHPNFSQASLYVSMLPMSKRPPFIGHA